MAKIISPVWSVIRGSIAGITYFPNQYGQIIARQRTAPVNPGTQRQTQIRTAFAGAMSRWRDLTPAQRQDWNDYAATCGFPDSQGVHYIPGREMFARCLGTVQYLRARGVYAAASSVTAPDWYFAMCGFNNLKAADSGQTGFTVECAIGGPFLDGLVYGFLSRAVDATRNFWKGPYNSETLTTATYTGPGGLVELKFTGLLDATKYFYRIMFATEDGDPSIAQLSYGFTGDAVAATVL